MSVFSEYLDNYMDEYSISSSELAKNMDIDRTTIHRYRKGKRIPADEETVILIAESLRMRTHEKALLMEKYDRVVMGDDMVNGYKYVKEMLYMFAEAEHETDTVMYNWNCGVNNDYNTPVTHLNSENGILSHVYALFDNAKEQGSAVSIIMQPSFSSVMSMIGRICDIMII